MGQLMKGKQFLKMKILIKFFKLLLKIFILKIMLNFLMKNNNNLN